MFVLHERNFAFLISPALSSHQLSVVTFLTLTSHSLSNDLSIFMEVSVGLIRNMEIRGSLRVK